MGGICWYRCKSILDINSSEKLRFVRFCDAFNIPIITLVDVPDSFRHSRSMEELFSMAQSFSCIGEATVPKVTVTLRKSYGGAHIVMAQLRGDINYAWPTASIAVMGADGAVECSILRNQEEEDAKTRPFIEEKKKSTKSSSAILTMLQNMDTLTTL